MAFPAPQTGQQVLPYVANRDLWTQIVQMLSEWQSRGFPGQERVIGDTSRDVKVAIHNDSGATIQGPILQRLDVLEQFVPSSSDESEIPLRSRPLWSVAAPVWHSAIDNLVFIDGAMIDESSALFNTSRIKIWPITKVSASDDWAMIDPVAPTALKTCVSGIYKIMGLLNPGFDGLDYAVLDTQQSQPLWLFRLVDYTTGQCDLLRYDNQQIYAQNVTITDPLGVLVGSNNGYLGFCRNIGNEFIATASSLDFCRLLCECGTYAVENPDICNPPATNNDCCIQDCIFQEGSISGVKLIPADGDPTLTFDQVGPSKFIQDGAPGWDGSVGAVCQWEIAGRDGNGTDTHVYVYNTAVGGFRLVWQALPFTNSASLAGCTGTVTLDDQPTFTTSQFNVEQGRDCPVCCDSWCSFETDAISNLNVNDGTQSYSQNAPSQYNLSQCDFTVFTDNGECQVAPDTTNQRWSVTTPTGFVQSALFDIPCNGTVNLTSGGTGSFLVDGNDCS